MSWLIEPEPPSWDMLSWLMALVWPMVLCVIAEPLPVPEWLMLSCDMLLWIIASCDAPDELWAKAGTANAAATRAAAAKVEIRLDMDDSFKSC